MLMEEYCKIFVQKFYEKGFIIKFDGKSAINYDDFSIKDIKYPFVGNFLRLDIYPKLTLKNQTYFRISAWIDESDVFSFEQAKVLTNRWIELQSICDEINKLRISPKDLKSGKFKSYVEYVSKSIYKR